MEPVILHPEIEVVLEMMKDHPFARFEGMAPQQARDLLAETFPPVFEPPVARVEDVQIVVGEEAGRVIGARLYHPAPGETLPLVVFFHGGGWVWGNLDQADANCRLMASVGNVAVLSVDYRLAPEHRFPAAESDYLPDPEKHESLKMQRDRGKPRQKASHHVPRAPRDTAEHTLPISPVCSAPHWQPPTPIVPPPPPVIFLILIFSILFLF